MTKKCKHCQEEKELIHMVKSSITKDGYINLCKGCNSRLRKNIHIDPLEMKYCPVCERNLPITRFRLNRHSTEKVKFLCEECFETRLVPTTNNSHRFTILRRRVDLAFKKKITAASTESRRRNFKRILLYNAEKRAKQLNLEFNLTPEDIFIPEICPILECPLKFGTKNNYDYSPSLDRIDNTRGYIKGNVRVISKKANTMKSNATLEELVKFSRNIIRYSLNNSETKAIELQDKELVG